MPRVLWELNAIEDLQALNRLDRRTAQRVVGAVQAFARTGKGDVKALAGRQDELRLRVGDWRIVLRREPDFADTFTVGKVALRRDAYDD